MSDSTPTVQNATPASEAPSSASSSSSSAAQQSSSGPRVAPAAPAQAVKVVRRGFLARPSVVSFLAGAVLAGGYGYYQLHQDLWRSSAEVSKVILGVEGQVVDKTASLERRVSVLEKELSALKSASASPSSNADSS